MGTAFSMLERPAPLLMTSVFFGCASVLSAPALADAVSDRLDEVSRIFAKASVISGPTAVPCRLSDGPASNLADNGPQIGIAMDGHPIVTHLMADGSEPGDLDRCNGHIDAAGAYHYHAGTAGSNAIMACLRAETGCILNDPEASCDATTQRQRP